MAQRAAGARRGELLTLAASMFAERGFRATTVRDIADAAGILSGSLYHHFDSKESMIDEILTGFLDRLFTRYDEILASDLGPVDTLQAIVAASFESIDKHSAEVAIYQNEANYLAQFERFTYIGKRNTEFRALWEKVLRDGIRDGVFRSDMDVDLVYRFMRDTVWVAVRWYRPGGDLRAADVANQYLSIVLNGISTRKRKIDVRS